MRAADLAARRDLLLVALATLATWVVSVVFELHERYFGWLARWERWQADEIPLALLVFSSGLAWYAFRRRREARRALAEREQARAQADTLLARNRELAQGLITLQESERAALARELHDEMGQRCTALRIETALLRQCAADDRAGALAAAARADASAQALYQSVRELLQRLRPAQLDELGLVAALQALCEGWELRSGLACIFLHEGLHEGLDEPLPEAVEVAVYRVAQEALTNAVRHAQASTLRLRVVRQGGRLRLEAHDDGRGMDLAAPRRGLGLLGASERAAAMGGQLRLDSAPGRGLRLLLELPVAVRQPVTEAQP
ncbi:ATP-binding protein [Piscinibacter defluvii]|uniref:ATP-binding protein n=1 Tax=Piscinibacter defluvii TaxID=1796922 RepID=UPI000FDDAB26|nr:ATP-binding protein [Piscinibacter defluvii]